MSGGIEQAATIGADAPVPPAPRWLRPIDSAVIVILNVTLVLEVLLVFAGTMVRTFRPRCGVVDENNLLRFESLSAMHRHDAHLVARDFHVALYLGLRTAHHGHKALQRWRLARFVIEREIEKLVERVGCLRAKPRQ